MGIRVEKAKTGLATGQQGGRKESALRESKHRLRRDIAQLADRLNALLPQYWLWVASSQYQCDRDQLISLTKAAEEKFSDLPTLEQLYSDLCRLEQTFVTVLSGPPQRKKRKMFI